MHILLVCTARGIPLFGRSGASAHLRGVARALHRAGHRVTTIVGAIGDPDGHPGVPGDVRSLPVPRWPPRRRARERAEVRHARRLMDLAPSDVDLVWHRHALHDLAVADWARRRSVHRWLEVDAPLSIERALLDPLGNPARARRAEVRSLRTADRVFVVSRWLEPWARALGARRVHRLANGTSLPPFDPGRRAAARRRLGIEGPVLGHVGSCRTWHRVDRLVTLLEAMPDATGLLVGDGPSRPQHPRLCHVPFQADPRAVADAVAAMDVGLVLGGLPWVSPLKWFDYRSQALPVLATPVGDAPWLAHSGEGRVLSWGPAWAAAARQLVDAQPEASHRSWDDVVAAAMAIGLSG